MSIATVEEFHEAIHNSVGTPSPGIRVITHHKRRITRKFNKNHTAEWATSRVNLAAGIINTDVYINFQKNSLKEADYQNLKRLAIKGIEQFWSRNIILGKRRFQVLVSVHHRTQGSLGVDMYIETSSDYARSHNSGLIDASFYYNKGFYKGAKVSADRNFMITAAHEFGHSVLEFFGGTSLSWGHKGSTHILPQSVKSSTPGYPSQGEIDLMKYYESKKNSLPSVTIYNRSIASEVDIKRLIWMSKITIK
jgi:hypothetical protein